MDWSSNEPLRVLIIEDDVNDVLLIMRALQQGGFSLHCRHADHAEAMRTALDEEAWDIIISDHSMPKFSAPEALDLLKQSGQDIPFIVVSGSIGEEFAVKLMKQGAADYLLKDRMSRLPEAIRHALREKDLMRQQATTLRALASSEARFRSIFTEALDVIIIIDVNTGVILDVNRMVEQTLRYKPTQLIGKHFSCLFPESAKPHLMEELHAADSVFAFQNFLREDNTVCPMDLTATLIPWDEDYVILLTLRDATQRLLAEESQRTADRLKIELEKEKELHELKNRFIAMASHEFRTPLTTIQLSANLLSTHIDRMEAGRRQKHFDKISESIAHTTALLDDVLFMGQAEAGALEFKPEVIDLNQFCYDVIETFQNAHPAYEFHYYGDGPCSSVPVDVKLMRHILTNLLSNAVKYSDPGSRVWLTVICQPDRTTIRVEDEGIGIAEKDKERLFQSFFRGTNVGTISGTGLGLAITQRAVERHGGRVEFSSQLGVGTTFVVHLPTKGQLS
ncbi:MAG: hypothetical protein OHK0046_36250 [Anaerolineae bacterium]